MKRPALGHIFGYTALTIILTAGAAQSLSGSNTVFGDDIVDRAVANADLGTNSVSRAKIQDNAVAGAEVVNDSLTGADINESGLDLRPGWTNLPLSPSGSDIGGSWTATTADETGAPQYAKDLLGVVHLQGAADPGTYTATLGGVTTSYYLIGTLPVGFRPGTTLRFAAQCSNNGSLGGAAGVQITTAGVISIDNIDGCSEPEMTDASDSFSLSGISFRAGG